MKPLLVALLLAGCSGEPETGDLCLDGKDNDLDDLVDCGDPDCLIDPICNAQPDPDFCETCTGTQEGWIDVSAGNDTSCGLHLDGRIACWGESGDGQLSVPTGTYTALSSAGSHSCGLLDSQKAVCWGENTYGKASPPEELFIELAVGKSHGCGLLSNREAICWGHDGAGNLEAP